MPRPKFGSNDFETVKRITLSGRTSIFGGGKGRVIAPNTYAVYFAEQDRVTIRYYGFDLLEKFPSGHEAINLHSSSSSFARINQYMIAGNTLYKSRGKYLLQVGDLVAYDVSKFARFIIGPYNTNKGDIVRLPEGYDNLRTYVWNTWIKDRVGIGKRWYFTKYAPLRFIHRCHNELNGMKIFTLTCCACGENLEKTMPDYREKINNAIAFEKLKANLLGGEY